MNDKDEVLQRIIEHTQNITEEKLRHMLGTWPDLLDACEEALIVLKWHNKTPRVTKHLEDVIAKAKGYKNE